MALIEDVRTALQSDIIDWYGEFGDYAELDDVDTVLNEIADTTRWGVIKRVVLKRGDEYVMATWEEAAAEGDYCEKPDLTEVRPVEKTVVDYVSI